MRAVLLGLLGSLAFATAAVAQDAGGADDGGSGSPDLSGISFNLAAPDYGRAEHLPEAATLGDLSSGGGRSGATATAQAPAKTARPAARPRPKPTAAATATYRGKPMSAWRRAYIARHGHQPPPAK